MKKKILALFLLFSISVSAQTLGGSFVVGVPKGEFKDRVNTIGFGLQVHGTLFTPTDRSPVTVGLNMGFMVYGNESSIRPLSESIPDVLVDVNRTNNLANLHFLLQVSPFMGDVRPYIEGLFGGAYLFTTTKVESSYSGQGVFESTNLDDFTWSYGGGFGMLIKLTNKIGSINNLFLDLKARYIFGTEAQYLKEGSVTIVNGKAYYDVQKSKTDLLTINVGVVAYF